MSAFKPLLAATYEERFPPRYPVLGSRKLDGIRVLLVDGVPMTRSLKKPVPSKTLFGALIDLPGYDGEVIAGEETGNAVCSTTQSAVMSEDGLSDGAPWTYHIFDVCDMRYAKEPYLDRLSRAHDMLKASLQKRPDLDGYLKILPQELLNSEKELWSFEDACVKRGDEGIMLRDPQGFYKWGRATPKSGILTKIKRWEDAEARILSTYEEMHNGNEAKTNALGKTERSSHKDNKTGAGRLGGYVCETYRRLDCDLFTLYPDQSVPVERIEFDLGAAANTTQEARARAFATRDSLVGKIIKFKYQRTEGAEKPRFNSAISIREDE